MIKKIIIVGVVLLLGWGGYQYLYVKDIATNTEHFSLTVRLGWLHQAQFAGMYVAQERGFYKDAGLDVTLLEADGSVYQTKELVKGVVQASIMEAHQFIGDREYAQDLKAVAAIYQINPHVLAAREDSEIKGPEDFTGKVIGLTGGQSEGTALFETFVESVSGADSVTYVELGFDTIDDFLNNRADIMDLYRIDQPYLAEQNGIPLTIFPLDAYGFATYGDVIVMERDFITRNPEIVEAFVKATMKGWEYAFKNPEEAISLTLTYTDGIYADRAYQEHIFFESVPLIRGDVSVLGEMDLVPWSTLYESLQRTGVISEQLDIKELFTNEFVQ